MKKLDYISALLILLPVVFSSNMLFSQQADNNTYMVVLGVPKYVIQINGYYDKSILELSGTYNSDFHSELVTRGETFGAHYGFGGGLVSKLSLDERSNFWFTQSLSYHRVQSYFLEDKSGNMDQGRAGFNCITGGLGVEYNFTPNYSVKIFAGAELNASSISGNMEIWFPSGRDSYIENYKVLSSFRMGYGLVGGGTYMIGKKVGINLFFKLSNLNAFVRYSEGKSEDKEFRLRDGSSGDALLFSGNKSFSFYSIGTGVSFYFGISEKRYRLR